jgi:biopolymer transport protein ExbD
MSRFRKTRHKEVPTLNTASLPDLIFTILFFFMIVTHIKPVLTLTKVDLPTASELQKLEEKSLVVYISVGQKLTEKTPSSAPSIQLNSDFVALEDLPSALKQLKATLPFEDQNKMIVVMKMDKNIRMGLVSDIKKALKEADLLTIHYAIKLKTD